MVHHGSTLVGDSFAALADDTRRGVLEQLGHADASITDLAARFEMTLTGMGKHVRVLERAGLVATEKVGRVRYCRLGARRLDDAATWIDDYQRLWDNRFRALDAVIDEMQRKDTRGGRSNNR
jgi:DNA-binding transcriptional ArsR family regulator